MDEETLNLLKEIQALRSSSDPIKEILSPLPQAIQEMRQEMGEIRSDIKEIQEDIHGGKDEPSLRYRIGQLEGRVGRYERVRMDGEDLKRQVDLIQMWKDEKDEAQKALKKTTVDTIVKTAIPWIIAAISGGLAAYFGLFAGG